MNRAPRITLPAADISGVFGEWAEQCDQMIVYQHDADATVTATHCHVLMIGLKVKDESLKRSFKRVCPSIDTTGGNKFWKWESKTPPDIGLITYMSKGKLRPVYVKNIPAAVVEELRAKWIERAQVNPPGSSDEKKKYAEFDEALQYVERKYDQNSYIVLDGIRSTTMAFYWHRDGRLPPATMYKRVAGTVFLKMVEKRQHLPDSKPFCVAMDEIKNLWY